jgi:formate/nitrite transporter FocA (FNT family)
MDKLLFWLGIEAAQKAAGSKQVKPNRHPVFSLVVGILAAALVAVGMFLLLVSQKL